MKYLDCIKALVLQELQGEDASVFLFGSWARGEQKRSSDVDVAIEYHGPSNRRKIAGLCEALEESTIPYRVDIVDMQNTSTALVKEIRKDGIVWKA
ncbi:MAG: nucleotidyltransferase domain-containing protein [Selenomonas sp.]|nr:nucleotidyltransferase domain-containing protein [Selenomonas sp.]